MATASSSPKLTRCTFSANTTSDGSGGGLDNDQGAPELANCTFSGNTSNYAGGGIANWSGNLLASSTTFITNQDSGDYGGGGVFNYQHLLLLPNAPSRVIMPTMEVASTILMERLFSRVVHLLAIQRVRMKVRVEVAPFSTMMVLPSCPIVLSRITNQPTGQASTITLMPLLQQPYYR